MSTGVDIGGVIVGLWMILGGAYFLWYLERPIARGPRWGAHGRPISRSSAIALSVVVMALGLGCLFLCLGQSWLGKPLLIAVFIAPLVFALSIALDYWRKD
jgi:hypothetical protein